MKVNKNQIKINIYICITFELYEICTYDFVRIIKTHFVNFSHFFFGIANFFRVYMSFFTFFEKQMNISSFFHFSRQNETFYSCFHFSRKMKICHLILSLFLFFGRHRCRFGTWFFFWFILFIWSGFFNVCFGFFVYGSPVAAPVKDAILRDRDGHIEHPFKIVAIRIRVPLTRISMRFQPPFFSRAYLFMGPRCLAGSTRLRR